MPDIDTTPATLNWTAYAGDVNRATITAGTTDPVDLTGATGFQAQARKTAADPVVAATATVTEVNLALGQVDVEWDGEELRTLLAGADTWKGFWDIQFVAAGEVLPTTMYRGTFTVVHDITRI